MSYASKYQEFQSTYLKAKVDVFFFAEKKDYWEHYQNF